MMLFDLFQRGADWWLVALSLALLLGPVAFYLAGPWAFRRQEILSGLSDSAIERYYQNFHPRLNPKTQPFDEFYSDRFGRRRDLFPSAMLALTRGPDVDEKDESELEKLQGIDTRTAERFADEGITTIVQFAYADPVELTMRCASFTFSFVVDCSSQALAWIYFGDNLAKLRDCSLRGAQEIANLIEELDNGSDEEKKLARQTID